MGWKDILSFPKMQDIFFTLIYFYNLVKIILDKAQTLNYDGIEIKQTALFIPQENDPQKPPRVLQKGQSKKRIDLHQRLRAAGK